MSYLVLARTSRPVDFDQVVGQEPVVRTLRNALARNRVAHAMIFSGVRGVGKTTLARIMARALNCEGTGDQAPCNGCRSCKEIAAGTSVDLVEIDGASNRGIQEIRELKENIRFLPTSSRHKIIIIDEVHMLTAEAFNALLKTLEEPPDHVYFMFATTELHKVPVTILSRCQRYELKRVPADQLAAHFSRLAGQEGVAIEPAALDVIVREAGGSVRDGLSLLDQAFSYCGGRVTLDDVTEMLGLVGHQVVAGIAASLLAGDLASALDQLDAVYGYGQDMKRFINDLLAWFRTLVVCSLGKGESRLLDLPEDQLALARECCAQHNTRALILLFNILMEQLEKAGSSSQPRFALEMAFIKAVQAREVVPVTRLLGRLDTVLAGMGPSPDAAVAPVRQRPGESSSPVDDVPGQPGVPVSTTVQVSESGPEKKNDQSLETGKRPEDENSVKAVAAEDCAVPPSDAGPERRSVRRHWSEFIDYVRDRKPWMALALDGAAGARVEGDDLVIQFHDAVECRLLKNRENITLLTEFTLDFFQANYRIRFQAPESGTCDVDPENGATPLQERKALANDSLVLTAVDVFNGEVGAVRVGPRFRKPMLNGKSPESHPDKDCRIRKK